eukprot:scaffold319_cov244-Pinguiococcus_pyrenoidosus.AAC.15
MEHLEEAQNAAHHRHGQHVEAETIQRLGRGSRNYQANDTRESPLLRHDDREIDLRSNSPQKTEIQYTDRTLLAGSHAYPREVFTGEHEAALPAGRARDVLGVDGHMAVHAADGDHRHNSARHEDGANAPKRPHPEVALLQHLVHHAQHVAELVQGRILVLAQHSGPRALRIQITNAEDVVSVVPPGSWLLGFHRHLASARWLQVDVGSAVRAADDQAAVGWTAPGAQFFAMSAFVELRRCAAN